MRALVLVTGLLLCAVPVSAQVKALRAGVDVPMPVRTKSAMPVWPAGLDGQPPIVLVAELTIKPDGKIVNATILRHVTLDPDGFARAVIDAVKQWEFEPTLVNGTAVPVVFSATFTFTKNGVAVTTTPVLPETATTAAPAKGDGVPAEPVRVGAGGVAAPKKTKDVPPVYPLGAQRARLTGTIVIEAVVDTEGKVTNARVIKSASPELDAAALDAVRQWEYAPTFLKGVAVPVVMTVTVGFTM